ncbi:MAG: hypothetical protein ALAOOOJD_04524 [bacterium]|nr:hypothetical protein [bacterium]
MWAKSKDVTSGNGDGRPKHRNLQAPQSTGAIKLGRMAGIFAKQRAERPQTFKSDFETNFRHGKLAGNQQLLGLLKAFFRQIFMRGFMERLFEEPQKVIWREKRPARNLLEINRQMKTRVNEFPRVAQALVNFSINRWRTAELFHIILQIFFCQGRGASLFLHQQRRLNIKVQFSMRLAQSLFNLRRGFGAGKHEAQIARALRQGYH